MGLSDELLTKKGIFLKDSNILPDIYYVYTIDEAIKTHDRLNDIMLKNIKTANYSTDKIVHNYFSIELSPNGKPEHIFTKKEIEEQMRKADDRTNNVLVIDGNGYAHVIESTETRFLYPVRHETWDSGNNYVGKYSSLSTLDDNYIGSLQGWLSYLETQSHQYVDYIKDNSNEEDLLRRIRKFY